MPFYTTKPCTTCQKPVKIDAYRDRREIVYCGEHAPYEEKMLDLEYRKNPTVFYSVVVGNLGYVIRDTTDYEKAYRDYLDYVAISKTGTTQRVYGETVTLLSSEQDEPLEEYEGQLDRDNADWEIADDDSLDVETRLGAINRLLESPLTLPEDCGQLLELYKTLDTPEE